MGTEIKTRVNLKVKCPQCGEMFVATLGSEADTVVGTCTECGQPFNKKVPHLSEKIGEKMEAAARDFMHQPPANPDATAPETGGKPDTYDATLFPGAAREKRAAVLVQAMALVAVARSRGGILRENDPKSGLPHVLNAIVASSIAFGMRAPALLALAFLVGAAVPTVAAARSPDMKVINLPGGGRGIGFDDLAYSRRLNLLIVPAGQSGSLDLVAPGTDALTEIPHVTGVHTSARGHWEGTTSAAYGRGYFYASDRDDSEIVVINAGTKAIVRRVKLDSGPDYVRYLRSVHELWVTEPRAKQIQVFAVQMRPEISLTNKTTIAIPGGPESLAVDQPRGRAYTNLWTDRTKVIDINDHRVVATWPNTCKGARGSALDEKSGFLFIGCSEGKAVTLDTLHDGHLLGTAATGKGVDIIAYNPALHHLYVPGADSATLTILNVDSSGRLNLIATHPAAKGAHCVTTDDNSYAYVCDPVHGRLLVFKDADLRR